MKTLLYIICLVLTVNAFTLKSETNTIPESFGVEYKEIIMNMESSCSDTVMNAMNQVYGGESTLLLKIKIDCDYEKANGLFKNFYEKYVPYFDNDKFNDIIDSITHDKYPQYDLMWGIRFNNMKIPYVKRVMPYKATFGTNNKCLFYSVVADSDTLGSIMASFNGYSLDYVNISKMSQVFYYRIHTNKKNISDVNIVKTEVYNNKFIEQSGHESILD